MKRETRASRGATAGSRDAFWGDRIEEYAPAPHALQVHRLALRFGLSAAVASTVAELAFTTREARHE